MVHAKRSRAVQVKRVAMHCAMYKQEAGNFSSADGQLVCLQARLVQAALSVFIVVAEVSELS